MAAVSERAPGRMRALEAIAVSFDIFIEGGTVVTIDPQMRVFEGDVLVRDGVIVALGPPGTVEPIPGARTVRAQGCYVLPGFVQPHVHLCQVLFRGLAEDRPLMEWLAERIWPLEAAHTARSLNTSARLGISELMLGGTTSALDMGTVKHTQSIFTAAEAMGFRLTSGKAMMDKGKGVPEALSESTADSLRSANKLADRWHGAANGRLRYAYAPRFILSCTKKLMVAAAKAARERGCLLHTHAAENPGEMEAVLKATGMRNIEALDALGYTGDDVVLAHCVHLSAKEKKIMKKTNTAVAHCPSTNLKLSSGVAPIVDFLKRGIRVGIAADGAPCNNRMSAFTEMRSASLLQKPKHGADALPASEALRLATLGGAEVLGISDQVGSLEVGKRGDIIVVRGDRPHLRPRADPYATLVYAAEAGDVRDVFVDGRWCVRDGEMVRVDMRSLLADAETEIERLANSIAVPRHLPSSTPPIGA